VNEDYYPAVVSRSLWIDARKASAARSRSGPGNAGGRRGTLFSNLLSGMAICDVCESPMNYRDRGVRSSPVLRCAGERHGNCSNTATIRYSKAEAMALESGLAYEPKWNPVEDQQLRERIAVEELRCQALDKSIERLLDALEAGEIQNARERLVEREEQRKEASRALSEARQALEAAMNEPSASGRRSILDEARHAVGLPADQRFARRAAANQVLKDLQFQMRCKADGSIALIFEKLDVELRSALPLSLLV
jgi:hypothetical protein